MSDTPSADDDKLVVAISSRALFDFEEENRIFDPADPSAYMQLQLARLDTPARPGVAFSLVRKLLAFNTPGAGRTLGVDSDSQPTTPKPDRLHRQRVEVVVLSRNDPVSGMRVFRSVRAHGLTSVQRGVFTQGAAPFRYLRRWGAPVLSATRPTCARRWCWALPPRRWRRSRRPPPTRTRTEVRSRVRRRRSAVFRRGRARLSDRGA